MKIEESIFENIQNTTRDGLEHPILGFPALSKGLRSENFQILQTQHFHNSVFKFFTLSFL